LVPPSQPPVNESWSARDERAWRRAKFELTSPAFSDAGTLPATHTCDGAGISPPLTVDDVPLGTKTLIFTLEEPGAPAGKRVLWLVYNVPGSIRRLPPGIPKTERPAELSGGVQGKNDLGEVGYGAPCPDSSGSHRYVFRVRAVRGSLDLSPGATKQDVNRAVLTSVGKETAGTRIAITQVADLTAVYTRRRP
jgi:Raf kinase inhibitor-like YbhB/YbcL family protein